MKKIIFSLCAVLAICACSNAQKQKWGLAKTAPDEFMVTTRKPLTLPPEYDLRPVAAEPQVKAKKYEGLSQTEKELMQQVEE